MDLTKKMTLCYTITYKFMNIQSHSGRQTLLWLSLLKYIFWPYGSKLIKFFYIFIIIIIIDKL